MPSIIYLRVITGFITIILLERNICHPVSPHPVRIPNERLDKDEEMKNLKQNISQAIVEAKRLISNLSILCPTSVHDVKYHSPLQKVKIQNLTQDNFIPVFQDFLTNASNNIKRIIVKRGLADQLIICLTTIARNKKVCPANKLHHRFHKILVDLTKFAYPDIDAKWFLKLIIPYFKPPFADWICKLSNKPEKETSTMLENQVLACSMINDMLAVAGSIQRFINL